MVTRNVRQTANSVERVLEERSISGLVTIAAATSGGVILAQRITDRVMPAIGLPTDPSTMTDALANAGAKGVIALGIGFAAAQLSGLPQTAAVFLAVGALTAAGVDLMSVFLQVPELNQLVSPTRSTRRASGRVTAGSGSVKRVSTGTASVSGTATSSGSKNGKF